MLSPALLKCLSLFDLTLTLVFDMERYLDFCCNFYFLMGFHFLVWSLVGLGMLVDGKRDRGSSKRDEAPAPSMTFEGHDLEHGSRTRYL